MQLDVRSARNEEHALAWPLYRAYIEKNIYPTCSTELSREEWCAEEQSRFSERWNPQDFYIVEIDGTCIGWAEIKNSNNSIFFNNLFIQEEWIKKGVAERIFSEMTPVWKAQKRVVQVPIAENEDAMSGAINHLESLDFSHGVYDGISRTMIADWTK
ncbi:MAG: hypothetical protein AAF296_08900 [Pseudomonadota bacterium]